MLAVYFSGNSITIQVFTDLVLALVVKCPGETFPEARSRSRKDHDSALCRMDMQTRTKTAVRLIW